MFAGLAAIILGLPGPMPAQSLSVSIAAGGFFASQAAYRQVYGSSLLFAADVWLKFKGPFGFAAGYGRVDDKGYAVPMDGGDAEYPVNFRRTTIPVIVFYQVDVRSVALRFGVGMGVHSYEETWPTGNLGFEGHRVSPRFALTVSVAVVDRLSFMCSVTYDTIRTGAGSPLAADVDLGGIELLGGLSFRIF